MACWLTSIADNIIRNFVVILIQELQTNHQWIDIVVHAQYSLSHTLSFAYDLSIIFWTAFDIQNILIEYCAFISAPLARLYIYRPMWDKWFILNMLLNVCRLINVCFEWYFWHCHFRPGVALAISANLDFPFWLASKSSGDNRGS